MRIIFLTMLFCAAIQAHASTINTIECTGKNPEDMIGKLTLDLDRQIFISSNDTNTFGDETLGLQKLKTRNGNLIYRATEPEGEFILTFYIPENLIPPDFINHKPFEIKLKLWTKGDGDGGSVIYSIKCAATPD